MEEIFDLSDLNTLFHKSKPMHDDFVTAIYAQDGKLILEYGKISHYAPYHKVTVTYTLHDEENDILLIAYKVSERGLRYVDLELEELNSWKMLMFKYAVDIWGEMTLYMNIEKGRRYLNAELHFSPVSVHYLWE